MRIGIIGGSGLYEMDGVTAVHEQRVQTPFGDPSDALMHAAFEGHDLVFLPRHGRGHTLTPSEVPYKANIWALKSIGVDWIISVSAVGSLREHIEPGGHVVLVDQFIDRTKARDATFFEGGIAGHISFGDPVCPVLREILLQAAHATDAVVHDRGTYVCMEGPAFSTRAESELYRSWGCSVVGMTNLPEAKLAREAEIAYATLAMPTDYDCWHPHHDDVSVDQVIDVLTRNVALARRIIREAIPRIAANRAVSPAHTALANAIMTPHERIPEATRQALAPIIGKYLK